MGVTIIPATKQWKCDCCGAQVVADHRPARWCNLKISRDAYEGDMPLADDSTERLYCESCSDTVVGLVRNMRVTR